MLRLVRKVIPSTSEYDGQKMFTQQNGKRLATPLLAVLIVIETSDVVFAVDSIPAILAVSREQFIVFSSNAFAILGLRALYFLLADLRDKFSLLQEGLAVILAFVGVKMIDGRVVPHPHLGSAWASSPWCSGSPIWLSIRKDDASTRPAGPIPSGQDGADVVAGAPPAVSTGRAPPGMAAGPQGRRRGPRAGRPGRPHDG